MPLCSFWKISFPATEGKNVCGARLGWLFPSTAYVFSQIVFRIMAKPVQAAWIAEVVHDARMLKFPYSGERIHHHTADRIFHLFHFGHAQLSTWLFAVLGVGMMFHLETFSNLLIVKKCTFHIKQFPSPIPQFCPLQSFYPLPYGVIIVPSRVPALIPA